ncbi:MAG: hypothetical protein LHV69_03420 [Elusimicrobia bacterium]|nr:hypothetical protein [Candidatus Obscuribacterium magneticum]
MKANSTPRARWLLWTGLILMEMVLVAISYGASHPIYVGEFQGLGAWVEFDNFSSISNRGEYIYEKGKPLTYRIRIKNLTNESPSRVEIQSSLHSDGMECTGKTYSYGSRLPGAPLSPVYNTPIAPGQDYVYSTLYDIPADICPSSAHLKVFLVVYTRNAGVKSNALVSPVHFQIR